MTQLSLDSIRLTGMRLLAAMMALLALATVGGELLLGEAGVLALLLAVALPAWPLALALQGKIDPLARLMVTITLVAQPAVMVFVFQGHAWQIDLHMIFFASLATTAVLCDWRALLVGAGVVAVHHLLLGMAVPDWVFLGGGGIGRILLHAVVLIAETVALVMMAHSVTELLDRLAAESARRAETEARAERERASREAELASVIASVGTGLTRLAEGDLTAPIHNLPPAYSAIERDFAAALDSLNALIGAVAEGADTIGEASREIADASDDLARRTETTAHSVDDTTQAVGRMDLQMQATAASAASALASADRSIGTVSSSRAVADEVVGAMRLVADSAKGIDNVIEGLDKIAFQTRVLAMNAAVEAGRAGEAGRGFAVVADLVSALAMRAEEEAKRARDQLGVTQSEIGHAVATVDKIDGALQSLAADVAEVHGRLAEIASDSSSQARDVEQVTQAVRVIDQAAQHNAAMVEETSATARRLAEEIAALVDRTAQFRTANGSGSPVAASSVPRGASIH